MSVDPIITTVGTQPLQAAKQQSAAADPMINEQAQEAGNQTGRLDHEVQAVKNVRTEVLARDRSQTTGPLSKATFDAKTSAYAKNPSFELDADHHAAMMAALAEEPATTKPPATNAKPYGDGRQPLTPKQAQALRQDLEKRDPAAYQTMARFIADRIAREQSEHLRGKGISTNDITVDNLAKDPTLAALLQPENLENVAKAAGMKTGPALEAALAQVFKDTQQGFSLADHVPKPTLPDAPEPRVPVPAATHRALFDKNTDRQREAIHALMAKPEDLTPADVQRLGEIASMRNNQPGADAQTIGAARSALARLAVKEPPLPVTPAALALAERLLDDKAVGETFYACYMQAALQHAQHVPDSMVRRLLPEHDSIGDKAAAQLEARLARGGATQADYDALGQQFEAHAGTFMGAFAAKEMAALAAKGDPKALEQLVRIAAAGGGASGGASGAAMKLLAESPERLTGGQLKALLDGAKGTMGGNRSGAIALAQAALDARKKPGSSLKPEGMADLLAGLQPMLRDITAFEDAAKAMLTLGAGKLPPADVQLMTTGLAGFPPPSAAIKQTLDRQLHAALTDPAVPQASKEQAVKSLLAMEKANPATDRDAVLAVIGASKDQAFRASAIQAFYQVPSWKQVDTAGRPVEIATATKPDGSKFLKVSLQDPKDPNHSVMIEDNVFPDGRAMRHVHTAEQKALGQPGDTEKREQDMMSVTRLVDGKPVTTAYGKDHTVSKVDGKVDDLEEQSVNGKPVSRHRLESKTWGAAASRDKGDLAGLGLWPGNNPQKLIDRLGPIEGVRATDRRETIWKAGGEEQSFFSTSFKAASGAELIQSGSSGKGAKYELRLPREHGQTDSQIFFQGMAEDTIKTTNRFDEKTGWLTTTEKAEFKDLKLDRTDGNKAGKTPPSTTTVTRSKQGASPDEAMATLQQLGQFGDLMNGDPVADFMKAAALQTGATPKVDLRIVEVRDAKGNVTGTQAILMAGKAKLVVARDGDQMAANLSNGSVHKVQLDRGDGRGPQQYSEIVPEDGGKYASDPNYLAAAAKVPQEGVGSGYTAAEIVAKGYGAARTKGGDLWERLEAQEPMGHFGHMMVGLSMVANTMAAAGHMAEGETAEGIRSLAGSFQDLSTTVGAAKELGDAMRLAKWSKGIGAASAAINVGMGIYDISQGEYMGGSLELAAGIGTGMTVAAGIWEGAAPFGPPGWILAGAATVGTFAWDYHTSNRVAKFELDE